MEPAMKPRSLVFAWAALAVMLATTAPGYAVTLEQTLVAHYPAGKISSVPMAQLALSEVDAARREAEQRFAAERSVCFDKFFTSSCLADAKEIRRASLSNIRKVEVEANAFMRRERAAERERTIAERQGRAARPLERPSLPITGAARDGAPGDASASPLTPQTPQTSE